ncbi:MAG TPA: alpha/beta hydrolase [Bryobacteraceae bacterium]|jgi:alpha-L-fucosidase 2|nr:alpha/beta hydrolase [Bryobacteraceae bacterium]
MSPLKGGTAFLFLFIMIASVAPARAATLTDIEYARPGGISLMLDASIPDGSGPFPAVVIVHGGGWVRGDRRIDVTPLFEPLEKAHIAWFSISYRLATSVLDFGTASSDVDAAVRFVKAHAAEYRIDPGRMALIGESAGGQLAAMAALNPSQGNEVRAVVALYAPTDLAALAQNSALIPEAVRQAIAGTPFANVILARLAQLSPIESVHPGMPPFLLIHGTDDPLVPFEQSPAMCKRIRREGGECEVFPVPGGTHGVRRWEGSPAMSEPYKREIVRWLQIQFAGASQRA